MADFMETSTWPNRATRSISSSNWPKVGDKVIRRKFGGAYSDDMQSIVTVERVTNTTIRAGGETFSKRGRRIGDGNSYYGHVDIESIVHWDRAMFDIAASTFTRRQNIRSQKARDWCRLVSGLGTADFTPAICAVLERAKAEIEAIQKKEVVDE